MPFDRATTSLQQVEEKLRNLFRLAGTIGAGFKPEITPVVVVGNTDNPGVSSFVGRHWSYASDLQTALSPASAVMGLHFPTAVLLHGIWVRCGAPIAGSNIIAALQCPDDAVPLALTRANAGTWIDNKQRAADSVPFLDVSVQTTATDVAARNALNTPQKRLHVWHFASQTFQEAIWYCSTHFAKTSVLWMLCNNIPAASNTSWGCWGRIAQD